MSYRQEKSLSRIPGNQSSRRVPVNTAKTHSPYTPQTGQVPGGNGPIEMLVNGGFSGSADGWTVGAAGTYADNAIDGDGGALAVVCAQLVEESVVDQDYRVTFNITALTSGGFQFNYGGVNGTPRTATGMYTQDITATSETQVFDIVCGSGGGVGTIDSVTLRKI